MSTTTPLTPPPVAGPPTTPGSPGVPPRRTSARVIAILAIVVGGILILGTVTAVENYGAGDLLDIETSDGRSVLMPFTKAYAPRIDTAARRIEAEPPAGLFEADDGKSDDGR